MKYIYTITCMRCGFMYWNKRRSPDEIYHSYRKRLSKSQTKRFGTIEKRTWGWYSDLKNAKKSIAGNWGDIFEGEYNMAVIEKVPEGSVVNIPVKEWWYCWKGSWKKGKYDSAQKPKEYHNVVGFWG